MLIFRELDFWAFDHILDRKYFVLLNAHFPFLFYKKKFKENIWAVPS